MDVLYDLTIYSFPNWENREGYGIGLFRTEEQATEVIVHYLNNVPGFRDYYCEPEITRLPVCGRGKTDVVYRYVGWDVDENGDEINVTESRCYTDPDLAQQDMLQTQTDMPRQEWELAPWRIGSLFWQEGFERVCPSGKKPPTLKEVRAALENATDPRQLMKVTFHYTDIERDFFPLKVGKNLFLATEEFDFQLDGFTIRRVRDVERVEPCPGIFTRIMEAEGWLDSIEIPQVDISGWGQVFRSLAAFGWNIIVEEEHLSEDSSFSVGFIQDVADDHVTLRRFDADGVWDDEPITIDYGDITSVTFGSRYINVFSKYLPPRP